MAEYSIVQDVETGAEDPNWIRRTSDSAFIPKDPVNRDYQAFLAWQEEGGKIDKKDPMYKPYVAPTETKADLLAQLAALTAKINGLPS